jgi:phosphoglycolate phosphatase
MTVNKLGAVLTEKTTIIFDLDGTLVDSAPDLSNAINAMLIALKREVFPTQIIHDWVGNGAKVLVERALSGQREISKDLDEKYCAKALTIFLDYYQQHACVHTCLYNGVASTLSTLIERGYQLHIVTNKPLIFVTPILKKLAINEYFEMILGADCLPKKKPDPMPLSHVCQTHHVNIEHCVMVGDSQNDILAANAINMDSIAVTYGYNYGEDITDNNPSVVCDEFSQLLQHLPVLT